MSLGNVIQMSVAEACDDDESVVFAYCATDASWEEDAGIEDQVWGWDHSIYQDPSGFYHEAEIGEMDVHYMDAVQYASELAAFDVEQKSRSLMAMEALGVLWYDEAVDEGFLNVPEELLSWDDLHEQDEGACKTPEIFFESRMPYWNFGNFHTTVM